MAKNDGELVVENPSKRRKLGGYGIGKGLGY